MTTPPPLIGGPYSAPPGKAGDSLICRIRGRVAIAGHSTAPIPWPFTFASSSRPTFILCGDLVRAVETESREAVAHWWGVSLATVTTWRQALGIGRMTPGTAKIWRETAKQKLQPRREKKATKTEWVIIVCSDAPEAFEVSTGQIRASEPDSIETSVSFDHAFTRNAFAVRVVTNISEELGRQAATDRLLLTKAAIDRETAKAKLHQRGKGKA